MACMTSEKTSSPLAPPPHTQKRCSLPGPMSSLNLYATHQQRRLSERGLMIYRPSKPDIDLIGEFINPGKRGQLSNSASGSGALSSSPAGLPTITSPSKSPTGKRKFSIPAPLNNPGSGCSAYKGPPGNVAQAAGTTTPTSSTSGCRKVRLRMQKSPGGKENKFIELQNIGSEGTSSSSSSSTTNSPPFVLNGLGEESPLLRHPLFDTRRYSDSVTQVRPPPQINISPTPDAGIVCSNGDLRALRCLTSSAQEIRHSVNPPDMGTPTPEALGNRSRSFDATYTRSTGTRKGIGSSWFSRRHLPISVKLPISLKSPSVPSSPGPNQLTLKAPILTVTNETSGQSEIIEVPSPPVPGTPLSSADSPEDRTKVAWDNRGGFLVDAAVLGFVIENHLRKTDMKRRATVCTLYEPQTPLLNPEVTTRARSASAVTIPVTAGRSNGSIVGGGSTSRRSSLFTAANSPFARLSGENREVGEAMMIRREKRGSLTSALSHCSYPESGPPRATRSHSYVETVDTGRRVSMTKTTTTSAYNQPPPPPPPGRSDLNDLQEEEEESSKGQGSRAGTAPPPTGTSICTAIRDFIIHSIRS